MLGMPVNSIGCRISEISVDNRSFSRVMTWPRPENSVCQLKNFSVTVFTGTVCCASESGSAYRLETLGAVFLSSQQQPLALRLQVDFLPEKFSGDEPV
jgi:hypothetical protein